MRTITAATHNKRIIEKINLCHTSIDGMGMTMIEEALTAGELLAEVKPTLPHGSWMEWVKNNLKFSHKTATNYMRLYELEQSGQLKIGSSLADAYKLVMSPPKLATVANLTDSPPPAPRAASVIVDAEIVEPTAPAEVITPQDEPEPLVVDGTKPAAPSTHNSYETSQRIIALLDTMESKNSKALCDVVNHLVKKMGKQYILGYLKNPNP